MTKASETDSALVQSTRARIVQLLEEKGMTILDLSEAVGISEGGFYSRFRDGTVQLRTLGAFAEALSVSVGQLLPESERGETIPRKPGERPFVEDRLEQLERKVRLLENQLKKR